MKYYKKKICEDKRLFKNHTVTELSLITGFEKSYISRIKSGKLIITENEYLKLKNMLLEHTVDKACK